MNSVPEMSEMTHERIGEWRRRLQRIQASADPPEIQAGHLRQLAVEVGANPYLEWNEPKTASSAELVYRIHQALQTASMIDACRTAAENIRVAERAQQTASKAQQAAFWSMVAAFGAVVVNIVVAYIMAATK